MGQTKTLITAEQLPAIAGDRRVELVDGELAPMSPVGLTHGRVVGRLDRWLGFFTGDRNLGLVGPEIGCVLRRNPDVVMAPDVCFIAADRLRGINQEGYFEGAPDLVVEVLSPDDTASAMQKKLREYLAANARLVWYADPRTATVTAYHPSGDAHIYSGAQEVTGEDVLPGFSFRVDDLFRED